MYDWYSWSPNYFAIAVHVHNNVHMRSLSTYLCSLIISPFDLKSMIHWCRWVLLSKRRGFHQDSCRIYRIFFFFSELVSFSVLFSHKSYFFSHTQFSPLFFPSLVFIISSGWTVIICFMHMLPTWSETADPTTLLCLRISSMTIGVHSQQRAYEYIKYLQTTKSSTDFACFHAFLLQSIAPLVRILYYELFLIVQTFNLASPQLLFCKS